MNEVHTPSMDAHRASLATDLFSTSKVNIYLILEIYNQKLKTIWQHPFQSSLYYLSNIVLCH